MAEKYYGPSGIVEKKQKHLIPCVYHFYKNPPQLVRGEMQYLYDHEGNKYLDFYAGVSVVNAGHCNPAITERTCRQLKTLQHTTTIYLTQPIVELAEKLSSITPGNLTKSFFCNSGSEANEGAVLLAKLFTGKTKFISLSQALHGRTYMTMSLTGIPMWRTDNRLSDDVMFIPSPYCYRCFLNLAYPACDLACAREMVKVLQAGSFNDFAAFIAEPVEGNGGIIVPPPDYFSEIAAIAKKHGMLFICDEIQTAFGRTGKMFAIENWGVTPDILTVAKSLANGLPVGAFITNSEISESYTRPGASTFGGNPVTAETALATLDEHESKNLKENARQIGKYFREKLLELKDKYNIIGDVRGMGLMLGAELVKKDKVPAGEETDQILEYLKDRRIFVGKTGVGRNVLAFQPPLVVTRDNADEVIAVLDDALEKIPME